jgi:aspartyl-tRNA(Asn)/glutamyl-tRNA(Gln) amidotransferase subunit C
MPAISQDEVRHVAMLAKLDLSAEELARIGVELNRILVNFAELQKIDTADTPVTSHAIPMLNVYREDCVRASLPVAEVVANAPDSVEDYFRVPRIVEE